MEKLIDLEIISPNKTVFKGKIKSITAPGTAGEFQILYNHASLVSSLDIGIIKFITESDEEMDYSTSGGILEVKNNVVNILAETIESKQEIELKRAKEALARAENRLTTFEKGTDRERAKAALKRAKNRLKLLQTGK
ncbi:MAG: ATP synthase F1 subunit epsilon [Ignavibacteria bacterium]|nr:ATP synthase F1 subunit epsilon [Ignavibacteria bacterium]